MPLIRATLLSIGLALCVAGAWSQEIVIGQTLSLEGGSANIARDLLAGRQACVDDINERGGISGRRLRLVTLDDKGSPELAVSLHRRLLEKDHAIVLFGPMGADVNNAVLAWAADAGIAVVGPFGGDIGNRVQQFKTSYFLTANQSAEAERLANHVISLGWQRVAVIFTDSSEGRASLAALQEALSFVGINPVAMLAVQPNGDGAASAAATAVAAAQVVFLGTSGASTVSVLKALSPNRPESRGLLPIYGMSSSASLSDLLATGARARGFSMSQVLPYPSDPRFRLVRVFEIAMSRVNKKPRDRSYGELEGCLAPLVLAEVLKGMAATATPTPASVLRSLRNAGTVNLGDYEIDLADRAHPGSRFTDIVFVGSDGRIHR